MPFAFLLAAQDGRYVLVIQFPFDQKVDVPFFRTGEVPKMDAEASVKRRKTTRIKVELKDAPAPSAIKPEYQGYALWAVGAKGEFTHLGAISKGLDIETPLQSFGLVISAEPDPQAAQPKGTFVLETHLPDKKTRYFGMTRVYYQGKK